jgi:hypothetical protein
MNKRKYITKGRVNEVAKFLKESIDWLVKEDQGCCHYNLDENFAIYVGWSGGYDMDDANIIKSPTNQEQMENLYTGPWTCSYAIDAAVKIRNDWDCADYEFLDFPWFEGGDGEVWDNGGAMSPNMTDADYKREARWFLETYVDMTNAYNRGQILLG